MSTAEIAIAISVLSAVAAALSLGWNIYRDIVLKPKVKVDFAVALGCRFYERTPSEKVGTFLRIAVTNFGPGAVKVSTIHVRDTSFWKKLRGKTRRRFAIAQRKDGMGDELPKKLEVGEDISLLLPYSKNSFIGEGWTHIGVNDTFGRMHWAKKRDIDTAHKHWQRDFGGKTTPSESANN